ncbi:hypothetical protein HL657_10005 [Methanoculleus sp. YWC-01]|uniref:Type I restriction modification DNA specificity domain-containing protein n=1 Tax=Methanoculleus nereidis TaxID=2735141 RepID=A0ABU3Z3U6_9EURY|nr:restriction endonuclease subunit S [Methanoculleus sp. YWC-01]MDV4343492.1 hypothetical protein [Methanoculleus sp. YWC-01]
MIDSGVTREEVPPGYKRTDVGVIPDDWGVMMLPEACWFQEGPGLRQWQFKTSGMKVINVTNLENSVLNLDHTDRHIALSEFNRLYQHFAIDTGDMVMASSGNSYGKTAIVREQDLPLMMNTSVIRVKPTGETVYGFLWAFLNSSLFKNQIDLMITGGAQPNFGPYHLKRVLLPFPSLPEQRAIATALSDVDRLIGALDALIEKKRAIKQAAMQQLLTGKTRLPGFEGKWSEKSLGELASITMGQSPPSKYYNLHGDGLPLIQGNADLIERHTIARVWTTWAAKHCNAGDLLLTVRAPVGSVGIATQDSCLGRGVCGLKPLGDTAFLFQALINSEAQWRILEQGSTFTSANSKQIEQFRLICPEDEGEQHAIAAVLSDMDAEIAALERRREKAEQIKQGMMQQLLTGRIRLVEPPEAGTVA